MIREDMRVGVADNGVYFHKINWEGSPTSVCGKQIDFDLTLKIHSARAKDYERCGECFD